MQLADVLERLSALPRSQRLALYTLLYIVMGALFWFVVYTPATGESAQLQTKNHELVETKKTVKARAENRDQFEEELAQLKTDLKQALRELPDERDIPELLKRISSLGKKAGLEVRKFQPLPEVKAEYYAEVPVALEVYGSYHEVAMFFDRLSKLGRIVYVQDIEMRDAEDRAGKVFLEVSGKAVTFRFLTEEEQAAAREQENRRGKRGKKGKGG